jgi:MarR family transcriptional regulator, organic hydroperoxide resistance regulator
LSTIENLNRIALTMSVVELSASAAAMQASPPADEAWSILRTFFGQHKRRFLIAASALDLHPAQAGALMNMTPGTPVPMNELANLLACDNSNVTGLVDRLEARGFVARRPYEPDRRVKHIVLTAEGEKLREKLAAQIGGPPEGLARLTLKEQRQLRDLLRRALAQR